jgi:hypothetical protein
VLAVSVLAISATLSSKTGDVLGNAVQNSKGSKVELVDENVETSNSTPSKSSKNSNLTAQEHMNGVSQKVQEILENKDYQGGIGQQIRVIAQQQNEAQEQAQVQLEKLKSKNAFSRKLFGPDKNAINQINRLMDQNQVRIQQLELAKTQLANTSDQKQLEETVTLLAQQNAALENQLNLEENSPSVFGWLVKLLAK